MASLTEQAPTVNAAPERKVSGEPALVDPGPGPGMAPLDEGGFTGRYELRRLLGEGGMG